MQTRPKQQTALLIQCSANKDISELMIAEKGLTLDLAIKSTQVQALVKQLGERDLLKAVTGAIILAGEYFNVKGGISETQAVQTAALWIEQYPMETFEDLLLCLKNAKLGKYGTVYNRIDGQTIFEWFRNYLDEKYERFEQIKKQEKLDAQNDADVFVGLAAKVLASKAAPGPSPERMTYETHFRKFKEMLCGLTEAELKEAKEYYTKKDKQTFNHGFQEYIDAIDEALKLF